MGLLKRKFEVSWRNSGFPLAGAIERNLDEVQADLTPHIPREVALGYHFCFGTLRRLAALSGRTISARP